MIGLSSRELNPNDPQQREIVDRFRDAPAVRELLGTESLLDSTERRVADHSYLVRYRSVLRRPSNLWRDPPPPLNSVDGMYLRFLDEHYRVEPRIDRFFRSTVLRDFNVGVREVRTLEALVSALRRREIDVLIVTTPVTGRYIELHPGGPDSYGRYLAAVEQVAARQNVRHVDFGVWEDDLFADPIH